MLLVTLPLDPDTLQGTVRVSDLTQSKLPSSGEQYLVLEPELDILGGGLQDLAPAGLQKHGIGGIWIPATFCFASHI